MKVYDGGTTRARAARGAPPDRLSPAFFLDGRSFVLLRFSLGWPPAGGGCARTGARLLSTGLLLAGSGRALRWGARPTCGEGGRALRRAAIRRPSSLALDYVGVPGPCDRARRRLSPVGLFAAVPAADSPAPFAGSVGWPRPQRDGERAQARWRAWQPPSSRWPVFATRPRRPPPHVRAGFRVRAPAGKAPHRRGSSPAWSWPRRCSPAIGTLSPAFDSRPSRVPYPLFPPSWRPISAASLFSVCICLVPACFWWRLLLRPTGAC